MKFLETFGLIAVMLLFGSYNTINSKLQYQTACPTLPEGSGTHLFNKPWIANLFMFSGESLLLLPLAVRGVAKRRARAQKGKLSEPLVARSKQPPAYIFAIPALCDVLGTGVSSVAMMFLDAAVWQMMRGSIIVFTAILSVTFLRRMLYIYHWVGVLLTVIGLFLVGAAAVMGQPASQAQTGNMGLGIGLVILAQVFSAFQFIFEEHLLTGASVSSLKTVGMEGVWGILYMIVVLAIMTRSKGSDHGVYESVPDGIFMFKNSTILQVLVVSYMLSIGIYNYVGMQLCRKLSAVTRCLVDCMRTATVWGFQLFLHYFVSDQYGEAWNEYSYLQVIGFGFLILGALVYNGVVKLPAMDYRGMDRLSQKYLRATWSPTVNRAAAWGMGSEHGPQSPHSPNSPADSPLPAPFGSPPADSANISGGFAKAGDEVIMEGLHVDASSKA